MALITHADWTCQYNGCISPLSASSPLQLSATQRLSKHIPFTWIISQKTLQDLKISLLPTDLSYILTGDVSILHLYNISKTLSSFKLPPDFIPFRTFSNFARYGLTLLRHFGEWSRSSPTSLPFAFDPLHESPYPNSSLRRDWPLFQIWLQTLPSLLSDISKPDPLLLLPRQHRQQLAESTLITFHNNAPSILQHSTPLHLYASDASSITTHFIAALPHPSVTFAAVANQSVLTCSLSYFRNSASILRGEAYGIAAALVLALHQHSSSPTPPEQQLSLFSDHLSSVKLINTLPLSTHRLARNPARSLYRWISDLNIRASTSHIPIHTQHVTAHTSSSSPPAQLNRLADHIATSAQHTLPPPAPLPTFFMDEYTPFSDAGSWLEGSLLTHVQHSLAQFYVANTSSLASFSLSNFIHDYRPPPDFPYTRASSSYSAVVQLYLRAHQLDTAYRLSRRLQSGQQPYCRFGCSNIEDARHVFVHCPRFASLRDEVNKTIVSATTTLLDVYQVPAQYHSRTLEHACTISFDSQSWPLGCTMYYYGVLPDMNDITRDLNNAPLPATKVERLRHNIANTWHTHLIRLAGRIWGIVRRTHSPSPDTKQTTKTIISLPTHLSHIAILLKSQKFHIIPT
ncbi:hypothetical protein Hypma_002957 [Hypsizygus marmoreus]|uniref:Uncharacterized protein n=1 Tax=Hypsizygus marmoreus TaxID=39966 RepID=A0A369J7V8_HYPMA|nr:hypothetical protein Hypma_002957 [Hypsizygus marmoreus]